MMVRRVALALVILMISSTVAVGATTSEPTATAEGDEPAPLGLQVTEFMQASAAQADGTVGNGLWAAAFARTENESEQRALVEWRIETLNSSLEELKAERDRIQAAYDNGSIDRVTYRAQLSTIVGQLAALGDGIEDTSNRGRAVGLDDDKLDELRTNARMLGGGAVSEIARNLTGNHDPPGQAGVFDDDHPGQGDDHRPDNAGNGQGPPTDRGPDGSDDGNTTASDSEPTEDGDS